jgi:hypothetical protein
LGNGKRCDAVCGFVHWYFVGVISSFIYAHLPCFSQRYFVLAESTTCFCVLRIFSRAVVTAWGTAPVGLHASIPIYSMESVEALSLPAAKGTQWWW